VAAAGRVGLTVLAGIVWLLATTILQPGPTRAADPPAAQGPDAPRQPPTCAERYPADGPAGIDLQLGCLVNELVGHFTGADAGPGRESPRISAYLGPIALGAFGLVGLLLGLRVARRSAGRRLAPAAPTSFWSCLGCRSLNAAGRAACYRCGRAWEAGAAELRTDGEPPAPQSFGTRDDV
jgi:hypothetical protein